MLHRLFTLLAAVSFLLLLPEVALWVRGYWVYDSIWRGRWIALESHGRRTHFFGLDSSRGTISVQDDFVYDSGEHSGSGGVPHNDFRFVWDHGTPSTNGYTADLAHLSKYDGVPGPEREYHALGITVLYRNQYRDSRETGRRFGYQFQHRVVYVEVPWAILVLPTSLLPALWIYRRWKRSRLTAGVKLPCSECGYSLVGNKSGICPECGKAIVAGREPDRFVPAYTFPVFALVSFLFCLSTLLLSVRSYWNADGIDVSNRPTTSDPAVREIMISSSRGALIIEENSTDPKSNFWGRKSSRH